MIECKYSLYSLAVVVKVVISLRLFGSVVKLHSVPSQVYNHANHQILINHATVRALGGFTWDCSEVSS